MEPERVSLSEWVRHFAKHHSFRLEHHFATGERCHSCEAPGHHDQDERSSRRKVDSATPTGNDPLTAALHRRGDWTKRRKKLKLRRQRYVPGSLTPDRVWVLMSCDNTGSGRKRMVGRS
ncbi:hypothetical protein K466DRAFT_215923 [Polyporus arcularius HHB13444]|uniref:Uncharacterized protein n=1 Tax=Polyporus arcularius HHB13444 TaxID=1314778 RepID=A0A5C3P5E1_9APHY|nr:hypothetical protein K466DRAFT_215923 [Polyporus arcularius HHB13444]